MGSSHYCETLMAMKILATYSKQANDLSWNTSFCAKLYTILSCR